MTIRFANLKTIAGVAAVGGMVTVGAGGLTGTAQADNTDTPAKPKPGVSSDVGVGKSVFGGPFGGAPGGGAPNIFIPIPVSGFPHLTAPPVVNPKQFPFGGYPTIPAPTFTFPSP